MISLQGISIISFLTLLVWMSNKISIVAQPPGLLGGKMEDKIADAACSLLKKCKTKIQFGKAGGRMSFCPNGDCTTGKQVDLRVSRLIEVNSLFVPVNNNAENFDKSSFNWSTPVTTLVNGTNKTTTFYEANITVGKASDNKKAYFKLTVDLYVDNTTVTYGKQLLDISAGSLKFTLDVQNWPWLSNKNKLLFGMDVRSRGNDTAGNNGSVVTPPKFNVTFGKGRSSARIERLKLPGGSFVDAPAIAVIDGVETNITSKSLAIEDRMDVAWIFPYFNKTLYYDPVVADADTATVLKMETTTTTTNSGNSLFYLQAITLFLVIINIVYLS